MPSKYINTNHIYIHANRNTLLQNTSKQRKINQKIQAPSSTKQSSLFKINKNYSYQNKKPLLLRGGNIYAKALESRSSMPLHLPPLFSIYKWSIQR